MKKMTINLAGKPIGCEVLQVRKNSTILQPEGKKNLFKGNVRIRVTNANLQTK